MGHPGPTHLQHVLKLVDAEPQLSHAGLEELPKAILLHQPHKHTESLFLRHLRDGQVGRGLSVGRVGRGCLLLFFWTWNTVLGLFLLYLSLMNVDCVGCLNSHNEPLVTLVY